PVRGGSAPEVWWATSCVRPSSCAASDPGDAAAPAASAPSAAAESRSMRRRVIESRVMPPPGWWGARSCTPSSRPAGGVRVHERPQVLVAHARGAERIGGYVVLDEPVGDARLLRAGDDAREVDRAPPHVHHSAVLAHVLDVHEREAAGEALEVVE